jgi:hypothetical protein
MVLSVSSFVPRGDTVIFINMCTIDSRHFAHIEHYYVGASGFLHDHATPSSPMNVWLVIVGRLR